MLRDLAVRVVDCRKEVDIIPPARTREGAEAEAVDFVKVLGLRSCSEHVFCYHQLSHRWAKYRSKCLIRCNVRFRGSSTLLPWVDRPAFVVPGCRPSKLMDVLTTPPRRATTHSSIASLVQSVCRVPDDECTPGADHQAHFA